MKRKLLLSVRNALLVTTITALVPALVIIVVTGIEHGRSREDAARAEAHRQVESLVQIHLETVLGVRRVLETLGAMASFREDNRSVQNQVLSNLLSMNPEIVNFAVTDTAGIVTVSPLLEVGTNLSGRKHVQNALREERFSTGEFVLARAGGVPSFPFAYPLHDSSGVLMGTIATVYSLEAYRTLFDRMSLPEGVIAGITDHRGIRVFFRPELETNEPELPIVSTAWDRLREGDNTGAFINTGSDGVQRYYAYRRVYLPGSMEPHLYVVTGYPDHLTTGMARWIILRNVSLMVGAVLFAFLVALLLGDRVFTRGFRRIVHTAQAISEGQLHVRTGIAPGRVEVAVLACALDRMAEKLEQREREKEAERQLLDRSLQDKEVLLREIHHRVKNNMQLILSIVHLQSDEEDPEAFRGSLESRINAMATVHEMLYESPDVATVEVAGFLERLAETAVQSTTCNGRPPWITTKVSDVRLPIEQVLPLGLIASELMTNACKYGASADGLVTVEIEMKKHEQDLELIVRDHGPGMDACCGAPAGGLGLNLVAILTEQMRGTIELSRSGVGTDPDTGAIISIRFPLARSRRYGENSGTAPLSKR